ncbi:MAG: threo-3-hydroxy-L-aspartate ammonia-lyase [Burkholderiaceae bacterium]
MTLAVSFQDVRDAAARLAGHARRTPVMTSRTADERLGARLFFKCENLQRIGAFKFRGGYNAIARLDDAQRGRGVLAFSSGNHAQAIALAARLQRVVATILMPADAPASKIAATRDYGAEVVTYDRMTQDREALARALADERGLTLIPPYDHPDVIAGQGTAALELFEDVPALDKLVVCVGGGGLISGCALAAAGMAPGCEVHGVEPEAGNDVQQSLRAGRIVTIPVPRTIADGAQTTHAGALTFPIIRAHVRDVLTVTDAQLVATMRFFAERMKLVVEPTGCLAAAAVLQRVLDVRGARVGIIVSGGNVDLIRYASLLAGDERWPAPGKPGVDAPRLDKTPPTLK